MTISPNLFPGKAAHLFLFLALLESFIYFRFESYATLEYDGKFYMTPRDFLDSVINSEHDFKTKIRRRKVSPQEVGYMLRIGTNS